MTQIRCAIYTRKSSDEGLDQEFNSLDAQYEACRAYITSQKHEGWRLVRQRYDDGGLSGGTMERPGLKALLADIDAGHIDVVLIYKIDRLTRSLADFARIVECLEKAKASFVSVTQSFNTKTSMGRLMLHVLLSFAQFEREVGAERVRDKIAASKAKGLWMGGTVPLGYDVVEKKLTINESEAETVRALFDKFIELKSVPATVAWARTEGLRTKRRLSGDRPVGGKAFEYGALRRLLSNRTYVGEIEHRGLIHVGQQEAILSRETFDVAQVIFASANAGPGLGSRVASASLLQGLIFDRHRRSMGPVHTQRRGQRFRYYVTHAKGVCAGDPSAYRMPAAQIDAICCDLLAAHIADQVDSIDKSERAKQLEAILRCGHVGERRRVLVEQVARVVIGDAELTVEFLDGTQLVRTLDRIRHGNDAKLVVGNSGEPSKASTDPQLLILLRDVNRAQRLALSKPKATLAQLAKAFGRSPERFKRLLRLSYLSPRIIQAIIDGRQQPDITNRYLQNLDRIPHVWSEQERLLLR